MLRIIVLLKGPMTPKPFIHHGIGIYACNYTMGPLFDFLISDVTIEDPVTKINAQLPADIRVLGEWPPKVCSRGSTGPTNF